MPLRRSKEISHEEVIKLDRRIKKIKLKKEDIDLVPIEYNGRDIYYQYTFTNYKQAQDYALYMRVYAASCARIKKIKKGNKMIYRLYYD